MRQALLAWMALEKMADNKALGMEKFTLGRLILIGVEEVVEGLSMPGSSVERCGLFGVPPGSSWEGTPVNAGVP